MKTKRAVFKYYYPSPSSLTTSLTPSIPPLVCTARLTVSLSIPLLPPSLFLPVVSQQDTSMVWVTAPTPSVLSEWVQARERDPSTEPPLVREAVLERARRVILAEGTGRNFNMSNFLHF